MKKECQFILLPTKEASNIHLEEDGVIEYYKNSLPNIKANPHHLYILSDDKIKEGDKCYDQIYKRIVIIKSIKGNFVSVESEKQGLKHSNIDNLKKVIATTNPELLTGEFIDDGNQAGYGSYKDEVASISQSDIEYIISLYNEDKRVDIEVKANKWALDNADKTMETNSALNKGFIGGYNQCLQDNADKKYNEDHMRKLAFKVANGCTLGELHEFIQSLTKEQPKNDTLIVEYEYANGGYSNTNEPPPLIPKLKDNCIIIHKT